MKKSIITHVLPIIMVLAFFMTSAFATNIDMAAFTGSYQSEDVAIGSSNEVTMVGEVKPTIMSVTMPTYVPFDISRSVQGENKVISPRITVTNKSSVPVSLDVVYTAVDLSKLQGTTWNHDGNVGDNQIAIGFQAETTSEQAPTSLSGTRWLVDNTAQNTNIASMGALESATLYVVGTLGKAVPENNSFTVTPTFVVREA